jgi:hypothetical protein
METVGAPIDLGRIQGRSCGALIRAHVRTLRRTHTRTSWSAARRRVRRAAASSLARFLPQQCERVEGVAAGAGVGVGSLQVAEATHRMHGVGFVGPDALQLSLRLPPTLAPLLLLRTSVPDAGGFASAELTCAPWSGALGGINSEGIAVLCVDDRARFEPSLRFLAQELLFRARDLEAGIEHLRRRAAYAGGSGILLASGPGAPPRGLAFTAGALEVTTLAAAQHALPPRFSLRVEPEARELVWTDPHGTSHRLASPDTLEVRDSFRAEAS